jgi:hypothetical protein
MSVSSLNAVLNEVQAMEKIDEVGTNCQQPSPVRMQVK